MIFDENGLRGVEVNFFDEHLELADKIYRMSNVELYETLLDLTA